MADQTHIQRLRGDTAKSDNYTGLSGEVTINTDSKSLRIHDGVKRGGYGTIGSIYYDVLPDSVPNDLRDDALVVSGAGPIGGVDLVELVRKVQELEARVEEFVQSKAVASYDVLPDTVPSSLDDSALVVSGTGPLA